MKRVDRLRDEDIDYGDIPELGDEVFARPLVPRPPNKETITIRVDSDVLGWFRRQGSGYQTRINQLLRRYMDVAGRRAGPVERPRREAPRRQERKRSRS